MSQLEPLVTVLLSIYNAERYVGIAIDSILGQSYSNIELIAVDDCSKDNSWEILKKYANQDSRIVAIRNEVNLGGCETLNVGLRVAKGKYVARIDNDDWSYPERIQKQVDFMEAHPDVGIVGGAMEIMDGEGKIIGKRTYNLSDEEIRKKIFKYSPYSHPLVMFRKSILDQVGYYDKSMAPADDYDLYFRIGKISKFANLPDVLLKYRVLPSGMTFKQTKKMELATIKVRNKYSRDSSYHFSITDRIYNFLHYFSIFIIPPRLKIYIFNLLRNE